MSVDREYKIKIVTTNEGAGATDATQDLKDLGKSANKSGEEMDGLNKHTRETHELFRKLDELLPGTGTLLKAAFNPESIGIIGMIVGIEAIKNAIESYNKKLEEMSEAAAKADFAESFTAAIETAKQAQAAADEYRRTIDDIKKGEHGIVNELNARLQLIAAIQAAQQNAADAEKTLALAKLKEDEISGRVSQSGAIIRRGEIEKKNIEDKRHAAEEQYQQEQHARKVELDKAVNQKAALDRAQADAEEKLNKAKQAQDLSKTAPTIDEVRKQQLAADEARENADKVGELPHSESNMPQIQEAEAAARHAQERADLAERQYSQAQQANKVNLDLLQNELKAKEKAAKENQTAISTIQQEMKDAGTKENNPDISQARNRDEAASEKSVDSQTRTELMNRARALQNEFQNQGPQMSKQDIMELIQLLQMVMQKVIEQGQGGMSKQEIQRELQTLRRLIETKGK